MFRSRDLHLRDTPSCVLDRLAVQAEGGLPLGLGGGVADHRRSQSPDHAVADEGAPTTALGAPASVSINAGSSHAAISLSG